MAQAIPTSDLTTAQKQELAAVVIAGGAAGTNLSNATFTRTESGAVSRAVLDKLREVLSPKDFGAEEDGVELTGGTTTSGDATVSFPGATFTSADIGKLIQIVGAGASGANLCTTIASINSATSVEMATTAGTSLAGTARAFYGTDDLQAYIDLFAAVEAAGGGVVRGNGGISVLDLSALTNGETLIDVSGASGLTWDFAGSKIVALEDFSVGTDRTVFFLNLAACRNVRIRNANVEFRYDSGATSFEHGATFVSMKGSGRVHIDGSVYGGRVGVFLVHEYGDDAGDVSGQLELTLRTDGTAYALAAYEAQQLKAAIRSDAPQRAALLVNCKQVDLHVESLNHITETVLLISEAATGRLTTHSADINIDYVCPGRTSATDPGTQVAVVMRSMSGSPAQARGLRVNMLADFSGGAVETGGIYVIRQYGNGTSTYTSDAGAARGHIIELPQLDANLYGLDGTTAPITFADDWPAGETVIGSRVKLSGEGSGGTALIDTTAFDHPMELDAYAPSVTLDPQGWSGGKLLLGRAQFANVTMTKRMVLGDDLTLYVRTDGADTNSGLANTAAGAFLTLQAAIDFAKSLDLNGHVLTISLGAGTFTGANTIDGPFTGAAGATSVVISGAGATTIIDSASGSTITATYGAQFTVQNVKLTATGGGDQIFVYHAGTYVRMGAGVEFGTTGSSHISARRGGVVEASASYTISGGAAYHYLTAEGGMILAGVITVTLTGTPAFSGSFLLASNNSRQMIVNNTYSGSATGKKYEVLRLSYVEAVGANLPGSVAGTLDSASYGVIF